MTNLRSISHHLGIFVTQIRESVSLDPKNYLEKIVLQFEIDIYKLISLPIDSRIFNSMFPVLENHQANKDIIF